MSFENVTAAYGYNRAMSDPFAGDNIRKAFAGTYGEGYVSAQSPANNVPLQGAFSRSANKEMKTDPGQSIQQAGNKISKFTAPKAGQVQVASAPSIKDQKQNLTEAKGAAAQGLQQIHAQKAAIQNQQDTPMANPVRTVAAEAVGGGTVYYGLTTAIDMMGGGGLATAALSTFSAAAAVGSVLNVGRSITQEASDDMSFKAGDDYGVSSFLTSGIAGLEVEEKQLREMSKTIQEEEARLTRYAQTPLNLENDKNMNALMQGQIANNIHFKGGMAFGMAAA